MCLKSTGRNEFPAHVTPDGLVAWFGHQEFGAGKKSQRASRLALERSFPAAAGKNSSEQPPELPCMFTSGFSEHAGAAILSPTGYKYL